MPSASSWVDMGAPLPDGESSRSRASMSFWFRTLPVSGLAAIPSTPCRSMWSSAETLTSNPTLAPTYGLRITVRFGPAATSKSLPDESFRRSELTCAVTHHPKSTPKSDLRLPTQCVIVETQLAAPPRSTQLHGPARRPPCNARGHRDGITKSNRSTYPCSPLAGDSKD